VDIRKELFRCGRSLNILKHKTLKPEQLIHSPQINSLLIQQLDEIPNISKLGSELDSTKVTHLEESYSAKADHLEERDSAKVEQSEPNDETKVEHSAVNDSDNMEHSDTHEEFAALDKLSAVDLSAPLPVVIDQCIVQPILLQYCIGMYVFLMQC
jgi:hypothetical protein